MAEYLSLYPPDVCCSSDNKIFIRFKLFALPSSITDNFYNIKVVIMQYITGVLVREMSCGNLASGDYTSRGKAVLWDKKNDLGETVASGIYVVYLDLRDNNDIRIKNTGTITFTIT